MQQFYDRLDQTLRQDWARQKETLFEELRRAPSEAVGAARSRDRHRLGLQGSADSALRTSDLGGSLDMHSRMMRYETAVASINAARRDRLPYGVVSALAEACAAVASDSRTQGLSDTWRLLRHLVGEREGSNGIERQRTLPRQRAFAKAYLGPRISPDAVALRQSLVTASLAHLEEQCVPSSAENKSGGQLTLLLDDQVLCACIQTNRSEPDRRASRRRSFGRQQDTCLRLAQVRYRSLAGEKTRSTRPVPRKWH